MKDFLSVEDALQYNKDFMRDHNDFFKEEGKHYYYYTSRDTASKILKEEDGNEPCFWISSIATMNDQDEAVIHNEDNKRVYALCFANRVSESIPMWYLYSGITGEGIRIGITSQRMCGFINDINEVYPVFHGQVERNTVYQKDKDFDLQYGWIYYVGDQKAFFRGKKYSFDENIGYDSLKKDNYFIKKYEWNYEREFRLLFHLKNQIDPLPEKIALFFDKKKMMTGSGGLSIVMGPEMKNIQETIIANEFEMPKGKVSRSKLGINMDLLQRNKNSIIENFDNLMAVMTNDEVRRIEKVIYRRKQVK